MLTRMSRIVWPVPLLLMALATSLSGQQPPYDVFPPAEPPYYRVRYEASNQPGKLVYPVNYTVWIPAGVRSLRGVIVHQHGCGEGSCKSGLTGAYDLHWQAWPGSTTVPCWRHRTSNRTRPIVNVVRSAERFRRRVSAMPGRSRREIRTS